MIDEQFITVEAFWELLNAPEYTDKRLELVYGEVIEMSKPGGKHGVITGNLFGHIWTLVRQQRLGYVTAAETGYILERRSDGRDLVRGLDIGFVRLERAPDGLPDGFVPFAPDLAVEVISSGNSASDIHNKVLELLRAGTALIWIVYPDSHTVTVYTAHGARILTIEDTLDGSDVLPGFTLPLRTLFEG
ncbi:MAG: Uma2 family endonuclease [Anaerolineae bacterium]